MKIGDKVTFGSPRYDGIIVQLNETIYTVVDINDNFIKVKHPEIGGHFVYSKKHAKIVESKK